jgi:hypothetical protein
MILLVRSDRGQHEPLVRSRVISDAEDFAFYLNRTHESPSETRSGLERAQANAALEINNPSPG